MSETFVRGFCINIKPAVTTHSLLLVSPRLFIREELSGSGSQLMPSTMQSEPEAKGIKVGCPHSFSKYLSCSSLCPHSRDSEEGKFNSCLRMPGTRAERQQREINLWAVSSEVFHTLHLHKPVLNSAGEWGCLWEVWCILKTNSIAPLVVSPHCDAKDKKVRREPLGRRCATNGQKWCSNSIEGRVVW